MLNIINSPTGEARVMSGDGVIDSLHLQGSGKAKRLVLRRGRMWTAEALHVSELANFTGRMLITRPNPTRWFFKIIEPGPGRARPPARAGLYSTILLLSYPLRGITIHLVCW